MNYSRWILAAILVLVVGCGQEQSTAEEEQTTSAATASTGSLDYVAFGDSLATGYGYNSYVGRYAALLGTDTGAKVN
ncbi:MAG: hypothetical protein M3117_00725, partial [Actinomycetota bacterium]|nr:hypothetical protein [Actinomycetota bacterium]